LSNLGTIGIWIITIPLIVLFIFRPVWGIVAFVVGLIIALGKLAKLAMDKIEAERARNMNVQTVPTRPLPPAATQEVNIIHQIDKLGYLNDKGI